MEVAMDWLIVNSEKYSQELENTEQKTEELASNESEASKTEAAATAKSIKCDQ